jgi:hypothetical protein
MKNIIATVKCFTVGKQGRRMKEFLKASKRGFLKGR